ncbi:MAG: hypothetical protein ACU83N_09600, partial [Gammaproteobacteria bacterium]
MQIMQERLSAKHRDGLNADHTGAVFAEKPLNKDSPDSINRVNFAPVPCRIDMYRIKSTLAGRVDVFFGYHVIH